MIDKNLLENLRHTNLIDVLNRLGYKACKESYKYYRIKNDNYNIVINIQTNEFCDNMSNVAGFGAIDLLMRVFGYNFKEAINFLNQNSDISFSYSSQEIKYASREKKSLNNNIPTAFVANLPAVKDYLTVKRKISNVLIDDLIEKGLLYADSYSNCVFVNSNKTYGFLRGSREKKFVKNVGVMDFIIYTGKSNSDIYLFESIIDALSFKTLYSDKDGVYVSTNGSAMINRLFELNLQNYKSVFCCFDNDEQGRKFDDKVIAIVSTAEVIKSVKKDFNDDLC